MVPQLLRGAVPGRSTCGADRRAALRLHSRPLAESGTLQFILYTFVGRKRTMILPYKSSRRSLSCSRRPPAAPSYAPVVAMLVLFYGTAWVHAQAVNITELSECPPLVSLSRPCDMCADRPAIATPAAACTTADCPRLERLCAECDRKKVQARGMTYKLQRRKCRRGWLQRLPCRGRPYESPRDE